MSKPKPQEVNPQRKMWTNIWKWALVVVAVAIWLYAFYYIVG